MQKADENAIGWCDFTSNPIRLRCPHGCEYCYMKPFYARRPDLWPEKPRLDSAELDRITHRRKTADIWIGSSTDMFADIVPHGMIEAVIAATQCGESGESADTEAGHRFFFLTKNPKRYAEFEFPSNCWLGVTLEFANPKNRGREYMEVIRGQTIKRFISAEPLLANLWQTVRFIVPDWLIIGADSRRGGKPPIQECVDEAVAEADNVPNLSGGYGIPVFVKDNLAKHHP